MFLAGWMFVQCLSSLLQPPPSHPTGASPSLDERLCHSQTRIETLSPHVRAIPVVITLIVVSELVSCPSFLELKEFSPQSSFFSACLETTPRVHPSDVPGARSLLLFLQYQQTLFHPPSPFLVVNTRYFTSSIDSPSHNLSGSYARPPLRSNHRPNLSLRRIAHSSQPKYAPPSLPIPSVP